MAHLSVNILLEEGNMLLTGWRKIQISAPLKLLLCGKIIDGSRFGL
jgi:hypothetical protein